MTSPTRASAPDKAEKTTLPDADMSTSDTSDGRPAGADKHAPEQTAVDTFAKIAIAGRHELRRPSNSLWCSGAVAGLAMSFSAVGEAALISFLPDAAWTPLVSSFGYSLGFLIVILGGLQLFTENTITPVLTVLVHPTPRAWRALARLWSIVFVANLIGVGMAAAFFALTPALPQSIHTALTALAHHAVAPEFWQVFASAIAAGFLIASVVWSISGHERAAFFIITVITYNMALFDTAHIIAGSAEALFLVFTGERTLGSLVLPYFIPALLGNIVGGSLVFALLSYGQIVDEIDVE